MLCATLYLISGMSLFDSIAHSLSTVAGGGFSTHDESIGFFDSGLIETVCIVFMLLSAASFAVHYAAIFGGGTLNRGSSTRNPCRTPPSRWSRYTRFLYGYWSRYKDSRR